MTGLVGWAWNGVKSYVWPNEEPEPVENAKQENAEQELSRLFYGNQDLHSAVENAPFVIELRERPEPARYLQYLKRLYAGLSVAEDYWQQADFPNKPDLTAFFRKEALESDIAAFTTQLGDSPCEVNMSAHVAHFHALAEKNPKLLLAHLGLRYYAILHGGQERLVRLQQTWGQQYSFTLYEFGSKGFLAKLSAVLNNFGKSLTAYEYAQFEEEIKTAWIFSGGVLEHDVRALISK